MNLVSELAPPYIVRLVQRGATSGGAPLARWSYLGDLSLVGIDDGDDKSPPPRLRLALVQSNYRIVEDTRWGGAS